MQFWIELSYRYGAPLPLLMRQLSSRHFALLLAAERLNPRGEGRADVRAAHICSTLANCNRDSKQRPKPFEIDDFRLHFGEEEEKEPVVMSEEAMRQFAQNMTAAMGGEVKKRGNDWKSSG